MLKKSFILLALTSILFLTACSDVPTMTDVDEKLTALKEEDVQTNARISNKQRFTSDTFYANNFAEMDIIKDEETGCKYLVATVYSNGYGLGFTPLLNANGQPDCGKQQDIQDSSQEAIKNEELENTDTE